MWRWTALEAAQAVREKRVRSADLVRGSLARIEALDPSLKAFVTINQDAERIAAAADRAVEAGRRLGRLHGVPIAIKDLAATKGLRTTYGCARYAANVPDRDDVCVARLKRAGAVIVGKTNTPEFGFGAVCANRLFGPTCNPFDSKRTSGGSSGGSAVAVATGMVPLAHGTDFGGSVRTPASFCGVVGLRPTPGRIPEPAYPPAWNRLSTHGVLARTVEDVALMFEVMAGPDGDDPGSIGIPSWHWPGYARGGGRTERIAFTADLGGFAPVDSEVAGVVRQAVENIAAHGWPVAEWSPDVQGVREAFQTLRAAVLDRQYGALLERGTNDLTESFVWNVARGKSLSARDYLAADEARGRIFRQFASLFRRYDILVLPAAGVLPFANADGDVRAINGCPLANIIDYLAVTFAVSLVGFPAISIPCGRSASGLPVGLQLVAPPLRETRLLHVAKRLQDNLGFRHDWPPVTDCDG
jgi:amidase